MTLSVSSDVHLCKGNGEWDNFCPKKMVKRVQSVGNIDKLEHGAKICDMCAVIAGI